MIPNGSVATQRAGPNEAGPGLGSIGGVVVVGAAASVAAVLRWERADHNR